MIFDYDEFEYLVETYGLEYFLLDNDLSDVEVLQVLYRNGLVDLDGYLEEMNVFLEKKEV